MSDQSRIKWLTAWAEPDGDQDTEADARAEVRWLLKRADDLRQRLHDLLENSAVISPPDQDPCFVDLQVLTPDYEAAYDLLAEIMPEESES